MPYGQYGAALTRINQTGSIGSGLLMTAGSVVAGLAIAFLLIALRPELVRPKSAVIAPRPVAPAPATASARATYADAVQRAAPAVVNIYTRRLVTERVAPTTLDELFGD